MCDVYSELFTNNLTLFLELVRLIQLISWNISNYFKSHVIDSLKVHVEPFVSSHVPVRRAKREDEKWSDCIMMK